MISKLRGKIDNISKNFLVLDVNGVGYKIHCSTKTLSNYNNISSEVTIDTELIVKEDSLTLYGFIDSIERDWFNLLQSVQGVGAKASLALLSSLDSKNLALAISSNDKSMITRAEGVGSKLAGRILNELKDKVIDMPLYSLLNEEEVNVNYDKKIIDDAISALKNLGFSYNESYKVVIKIISNSSLKMSLEELISSALKEISK